MHLSTMPTEQDGNNGQIVAAVNHFVKHRSLERGEMQLSGQHLEDAEFHQRGLRKYYEYRDLGVADATDGLVLARLPAAAWSPPAKFEPARDAEADIRGAVAVARRDSEFKSHFRDAMLR
jgi:hypothetical protein